MKKPGRSEPKGHAFPKSPSDAEAALPVSNTPQKLPQGKAKAVPPAADVPPGATEENPYRPGDSDEQPEPNPLPRDAGDKVSGGAKGMQHTPVQETGRKPMTPRSMKNARRRGKDAGKRA